MKKHADETEALWQEFRDRMLAYIRRRVEQIYDAEDILQEVFLRVHTNADRLAEVENIAGWIYRIAANVIVDHGRIKARNTETIDRLAQDASCEEDLGAAVKSHDEESDERSRELASCLEPLLQTLPKHYREAVAMTDLGDKTQKEAAEQLGLTVSGMKARVQRGRKQLKTVLGNCCEVELDQRHGVIDYWKRGDNTCGECGDSQTGDRIPDQQRS